MVFRKLLRGGRWSSKAKLEAPLGLASDTRSELVQYPAQRSEIAAPLEVRGPVDVAVKRRTAEVPQILHRMGLISTSGDRASETAMTRFRQGAGMDNLDQAEGDLDDCDLEEAVKAIRWYHTIELPGGIVTPGLYDQRGLVQHYGLPNDMTGLRVLDVGTWDGFWAFEMEARGADVMAVDLLRMSEFDLPAAVREAINNAEMDWPLGEGFALARRALKSKVKFVHSNVYELNPDTLGKFDLVHMGSILLSLENPHAALRRIRSMARGSALIVDAFDDKLPRGSNLMKYRGGWEDWQWWKPALDTLAQMVADAGFSEVEVRNTFRMMPRDRSSRGLWRAVIFARP